MFDWLIGGSDLEVRSAPRLRSVRKCTPQSVEGFKTENAQLRKCNATLLKQLHAAEARIEELERRVERTPPLQPRQTEINQHAFGATLTQLAEVEKALLARTEEWERLSLQPLSGCIKKIAERSEALLQREGGDAVLPPHIVPTPCRQVEATVLPPLQPTTKRYCIIFDVDETQVHFSLETFPAHRAELRFREGIENMLSRLCKLHDTVELGMWTAGVPRYAIAVRELLSMIARQAHVFDWTIARDSSWFAGGVKKDLSVLGRDVSRTLLIENSHRVVVQKECTLIVPNFYAVHKDACDRTLATVASLVEELCESNGDETVPQFLAKKAAEGVIHCQGGFYHVPAVMGR